MEDKEQLNRNFNSQVFKSFQKLSPTVNSRAYVTKN